MENLQLKYQKPNKGLARCAAQNPCGAIFESFGVPIKFFDGSRPERSLRQRHFHEQHCSLGMGITGAQFLRARPLHYPRKSRWSERVEPQKTILNIAKF